MLRRRRTSAKALNGTLFVTFGQLWLRIEMSSLLSLEHIIHSDKLARSRAILDLIINHMKVKPCSITH
jgi:hypothetical protein